MDANRSANMLATVQNNPGVVNHIPNSQEILVYQTWAKTAMDSQMYRGVGKESGIMMIMLAAREYGIGPAQALNGGLNIIEGKVELSARMMSALVRRARHSIQTVAHDERQCVLKGRRRDNGDELTVGFTMDEAISAGLVKDKGAWKKFPKDMLYARALSRLTRQLFSDVVGIGYVEGEITDSRIESDDEDIIQVQSITVSPGVQPIVDDEETIVEELISRYNHADAVLMVQFVEAVMAHNGWNKTKTAQEFMKDITKTNERFEKWKVGR